MPMHGGGMHGGQGNNMSGGMAGTRACGKDRRDRCGARGKRRGFSPGAAARHRGQTRVSRFPFPHLFLSLFLRSDLSFF